MISIINNDLHEVIFSKSFVLKIVSNDNLRTIYFTDGSSENFTMSKEHFKTLLLSLSKD